MLELLPQAVGGAALAFGLAARTMPLDRWLSLLNIMSLSLWTLYFTLIGGFGAVTSLLIGLAVAFTAGLGWMRLSRSFLAVEVLMIPVVGALGGAREMLPLFGGVMFSTGLALFSGTRLTLAFLAGELFWFSYSAWLGATFGMLSAVAAMSALLLREARRRWWKSNIQSASPSC